MIVKYFLRFCIVIIVFLVTSIHVQAVEQDTLQQKQLPYLDIWAMVNLDVIHDFKQMDPNWIGGFRPSKIPVNPTDPGWGTYGHTYFSVRQSTFKFEGILPMNHRWGNLKIHFSFDLFGMGLHAGETTLRLRMVYGQWGPFMVGRNWSTFSDLDAFPDNYEWWGPAGMALLPTELIRYTQKIGNRSQIELALELPGSSVDAGQIRQIDPNLINVLSKEIYPDFIARYTYEEKGGYIKGAVLLRELAFEVISINLNKASQHTRFGWALNITSALYTFHHKGAIRLQTVFGKGYAGYNNDGGVELAPDKNYNAVVPFQFGYTAFYDHSISNKLKVSTGFSLTSEENTAGQLYDAFHKSYYSVTQVIYEVVENHLMIGLDFEYGKRFNKNGDSANDERIMFTVRYEINRLHTN